MRAFAARRLGTDASPDEIFAWYAEELESRGWVEGGGSSAVSTTAEIDASAWEQETLRFRVSVLEPPLPSHLQGDWAYVYRTSLIEVPED